MHRSVSAKTIASITGSYRMLKFDDTLTVYLSLEFVDMRKSINGLSLCIAEDLACNPQDRALYIFYNRSRNKVKCLYWDKNGFVLIYKRLEKGRFQFSKSLSGDVYELTHQQLSWLLAGFDFVQMSDYPELKFESYA
jgi:transposase